MTTAQTLVSVLRQNQSGKSQGGGGGFTPVLKSPYPLTQESTAGMASPGAIAIGDLVIINMRDHDGGNQPIEHNISNGWSTFNFPLVADKVLDLTYEISISNQGRLVACLASAGGTPGTVRFGTGGAMSMAVFGAGATSVVQGKSQVGLTSGSTVPISASFDSPPAGTCFAALVCETSYDDTGFDTPTVSGWTKSGPKLGYYNSGIVQFYTSQTQPAGFSAPAPNINLCSKGWVVLMFETG